MAGFSSFDDDVAASAATPNAVPELPIELPADQQQFGVQYPTPADMVSDHSAEGAPWQAAARDIPQDPPQGPLWTANHDGPQPPYDESAGPSPFTSGPFSGTHRGIQGKKRYGLANIGQPFLATYQNLRHLVTSDQFDPVTGKHINPDDVPGAQVQIWNSEHNTEPRWIGFDVAPLFENVGTGPSFSGPNAGYLQVSNDEPNQAPRQWGAVAAQSPDEPYIAQSQPGVSTAAIDYESGW